MINAMVFSSKKSQISDIEGSTKEGFCQAFFRNLIELLIPYNNYEKILRSKTICNSEYDEKNGSNEEFKIWFEGITGQNEYSIRLPTRFQNYKLSNKNMEFHDYEQSLIPYLEGSLYYLNN